MRKLLLTFLVSISLVPTGIYSQYMMENFPCPNGVELGYCSAWGSSGPLGIEYIKITSPGLNFPGYSGSGIGNSVKLDYSGYSKEYFNFLSYPGASSGYLYTSLMVRVSSASTTGTKFMNYRPYTIIQNAEFDGLLVRETAGKIAFGIEGTNTVYSAPQFFYNVTYLLVLKHKFDSPNDLLSLYVFSDTAPEVEPVVPLLGPISSGNPDHLSYIQLIKGNGNLLVDGISINTYWNNSILPVELASFDAVVLKRNVTLNWITSAEINNYGFEIERSVSNGNDYGEWKKIGFVNGHENFVFPQSYHFTDNNLNTSKYKYRLKQIDLNGDFEYHELQNEVVIGVPDQYSLLQNYPNPFNPSTKIDFEIPVSTKVKLRIYDSMGKEVRTLIDEFRSAGYYTMDFNASDFSSGVYFYEISAGSFKQSRRMILMK